MLIFDIETDGFLDEVSTIHCIATSEGSYTPGGVRQGIEDLFSASVLVGHNIINYDLPVIYKLFPEAGVYEGKVLDTFILSQLLFPERGGHSLEWWGVHLGGEEKVVHDDWDVFSNEMMIRCEGDVRLTKSVLNFLDPKGEIEGVWL